MLSDFEMQSIAQVLIDSSSDNGEMETPWNEYIV